MIDKMTMVVDGRTKVRVRYDESDNFMLPMNASKIEFLVAHDKELADGKVTVQYELAPESPLVDDPLSPGDQILVNPDFTSSDGWSVGTIPAGTVLTDEVVAGLVSGGGHKVTLDQAGSVKVDFYPPEEVYIDPETERVRNEAVKRMMDKLPPWLEEPAVGDLSSNTKGSGARFNSGKPAHELLPLRAIGSMLMEMPESCNTQVCAVTSAVMALGLFQAQGDSPQADEHYLMEVLVATAKAAGLTVAELLDETAHVLDIARRTKYTDFNWANGMPWSVPLACASRHLIDHMLKDPRSKDEESGRLHAGHVGANVVMLLQFLHSYPEGDDRPTNL